MKAEPLDFLDDATRFKEMRGRVASMTPAEKASLLGRLEATMRSSAWATKALFKPGIRNFSLQEQLGGGAMVKQFEHFLGDQDYLFKFFFQDAFAMGKIPTVMDLVRQGINIPSFRFRLEAIDMLVEIDGARAIPVLFNLVSGLETTVAGARDVLARVELLLDDLAIAVEAAPAFSAVFGKLRLLLVETGMKAGMELEKT